MNIFVNLAKLLMMPKIKKQLKQADKILDDPEISELLFGFNYHSELLNKKLKDYCKRHPESDICRNRKK